MTDFTMSQFASKDDMLRAVMQENEQLKARLAAVQQGVQPVATRYRFIINGKTHEWRPGDVEMMDNPHLLIAQKRGEIEMQPLYTHPTQQWLDAAQKTEAVEDGDFMRVCVIENDGTSLIVPAVDLQNHIAEIADIEDAEPDDEVSYTLTFKSMPRADVDVLPEFNGF